MNILKDLERGKFSLLQRLSFFYSKFHFLNEISALIDIQEKFESGYDIAMMGVRESQTVSLAQKDVERNMSDPERFIEYDNLLETYNEKSLQLVEEVMNFWMFLESEDVDIDKQIN